MTEKAPTKVRFHYLKSPQYRSIHVDGAWGGPAPQGNIVMSVYSERFPIPQAFEKQLEDGQLGDEVPGSRITKDGVIREVEASLIMPLPVAVTVRDWLEQRIRKAQEAPAETEAVGDPANQQDEDSTA